jgi:hypothetical protein
MAKNYDLAAREFQSYLDTYPNGRYVTKAKQWKEMSTKEMLYKYKKSDTTLPENELKDETEDSESSDNGYYSGKSKTVKADYDLRDRTSYYENDVPVHEEENMAEL